jgi:hypothetical protein
MDTETGFSRRKFLETAGTAITAGAAEKVLGISSVISALLNASCNRGQDKTADVESSKSVKPNLVPDGGKENIEKPYPFMPEVTFTGEKYKFPKPNGIDCSYEDFVMAAQEFVNAALFYFIPKLKESFKGGAPQGTPTESVYAQLILDIVEYASKSSPELKNYIEKNKTETDALKWAEYLKPIFLAGGVYFSLQRLLLNNNDSPSQAKVCLTILKLGENEIVEAADSKGTVKAPIFTVQEAVFNSGDEKITGEGFYDSYIECSFVIKDDAKQRHHIDELLRLGIITERPDQESELYKDRLKDVKVHEAIHVYIAKRFVYGATSSAKLFFAVPLAIPGVVRGGGINMSGKYRQIDFQELCAAGSDIFNSADSGRLPLSFIEYFSSQEGSVGYELLSKVLPSITIMAIKDQAKREEFGDAILQRKRLTQLDFAKLAAGLSPDEIKRVGASLFKLGTQLLQKAEDGEFEYLGSQE